MTEFGVKCAIVGSVPAGAAGWPGREQPATVPGPFGVAMTVITGTLTSGNLWALSREISYGDAAIVVLLVVVLGVRILVYLAEVQSDKR